MGEIGTMRLPQRMPVLEEVVVHCAERISSKLSHNWNFLNLIGNKNDAFLGQELHFFFKFTSTLVFNIVWLVVSAVARRKYYVHSTVRKYIIIIMQDRQ